MQPLSANKPALFTVRPLPPQLVARQLWQHLRYRCPILPDLGGPGPQTFSRKMLKQLKRLEVSESVWKKEINKSSQVLGIHQERATSSASRSHTIIWRHVHDHLHTVTATEDVMETFSLMAAGTITEESCHQNRITNTLRRGGLVSWKCTATLTLSEME